MAGRCAPVAIRFVYIDGRKNARKVHANSARTLRKILLIIGRIQEENSKD